MIPTTHLPDGHDATHVARLPRPDGTPHVSTDFTTYVLTVYDDEGEAIYQSPSPVTVSSGVPIFDTLQVDGNWGGRDTKGYNFLNVLKMSLLLTNYYRGGRTYKADYALDGGATYGTVHARFIDVNVPFAPTT